MHLHRTLFEERLTGFMGARVPDEGLRWCYKGGSSSTQKREPWGPSVPDLTYGQQESRRLYDENAGFNPLQEESMGMREDIARGGSPLVGSALSHSQDVVEGKYLSPETNPFFGQIMDAIQASVRPAIDTRFAASGRTGSPAQAEAMGRGISRGTAGFLGNEYARERGFQESAARYAPTMANARYQDAAQLGMLGDIRQNKPESDLDRFISRSRGIGSMGGEKTTQTQQDSNPLQGILGLASMASGLGGMPGMGGKGGAGAALTPSPPAFASYNIGT